MKAVVFTLGCKVNQCESATLIQGLKQKGYDVSDELGYADVFIINTCAVTAEAEKKSRQAIARVRKFNPSAKVIITGCASEKSPKDFIEKENVFLVTGAKSKDKILDMLEDRGVFIEKNDEYYEEYLPAGTLKTRSYIKVQDGCNNFCSYCIVPYLRGRSRSRSPESIKKEIEFLKPTEAVITGINLSDYKFNGMKLGDLLRELKDYDMRIRLGSLEVGVIDDNLLSATKELKDFAPHFHLSLQSGSDKVLKEMNRKYTRDEYAYKVDLIRKYYPESAVTTDIIVGFSTENEKDFEDTLELVDRVCFSDIHCFAYSRREGTKAYSLSPLDEKIKKERLDVLLARKTSLRKKFIDANLGSEREVVIEETEKGFQTGYTDNYIRVYIPEGDNLSGKVKVTLLKEFEDGALAKPVD
ncbi:MAG: tRNA (N(6)-L-threonylcarbamoyladenosine(37)-C(2))-methylthiotransferase MtaB [Christensenellaceae bacterium]|nr:tRNA (N(6)-L-threonylcarbamoyladenosine(37)-C(2))-methylthiotransferase MtaB [Christensenellaceae bacterium]MDD6927320.1 tRNA (N(6)-L-threonylcarbamoyladenosine(37)-C(2))-methylthiotransferase MtaB [bacterium]MDY2850688.1 tRNA (N(6)-L-threonylcarbamoyladenosine(37)-C(2))-methylthiotransferase MtaB [Christensenellaceae bacterium]